MSAKTTYGKPSIGCYLDQSYRNPNSHNAAAVRLAMEYGFEPDAETVKLLAREENDVLSERRNYSDSEFLNDAADEAIDWLNEQETRSFLYWANSGEADAFGLWPSVESAREDCGFVSSKKQEYPEDGFEGEWLHVNDHGNATLYAREKTGKSHLRDGEEIAEYKDTEIWSVV